MGLIRSKGCGLVALLLLALSQPTLASAQASVAAADLTAQVDAQGAATVSIRYELEGAPPGVVLEVLEFGDSEVSDVRLDGGEPEVLWPTVGAARRGAVDLTPRQWSSFEVSYSVEGTIELSGAEFHLRLPVVTVDLPPGGGRVFTADVALPDGWPVMDGFPTGIAAGDGEVALQVVPSLVSARGPTSGGWDPIRLPLVAQLLTLLILAGAAGAGWRHLRSLGA